MNMKTILSLINSSRMIFFYYFFLYMNIIPVHMISIAICIINLLTSYFIICVKCPIIYIESKQGSEIHYVMTGCLRILLLAVKITRIN
jgi:hypothetical protein